MQLQLTELYRIIELLMDETYKAKDEQLAVVPRPLTSMENYMSLRKAREFHVLLGAT